MISALPGTLSVPSDFRRGGGLSAVNKLGEIFPPNFISRPACHQGINGVGT